MQQHIVDMQAPFHRLTSETLQGAMHFHIALPLPLQPVPANLPHIVLDTLQLCGALLENGCVGDPLAADLKNNGTDGEEEKSGAGHKISPNPSPEAHLTNRRLSDRKQLFFVLLRQTPAPDQQKVYP